MSPPGVSVPAVMRLLADPVRWRLMRELASGDRRVRELAVAVGQPQNLVSYHLRQLRSGGLVTARRSSFDGRDTYYSLDLSGCAEGLAGAVFALHPGLAPLLAAPGLGDLVPSAPGSFAPGPSAPGPSAPGPAAPAPASLGQAVVPRPARRVLFVCTGNSGRSPMAEGLLRHRAGARVAAASAGIRPKPVHPHAVAVLRDRYGVDIAGHRPVQVETAAQERFDYVISLCDKAREACPEFTGNPGLIHWSLPDPATGEGGLAGYPAFERIAAELDARIGFLLPVLDLALPAAGSGKLHQIRLMYHRLVDESSPDVPQVPLSTLLREWGRIGCIGFGGPPAHIRLLRQTVVERRGWLDAREFEDAIAVCNMMPGPASTQLAIFCAWRLRGRAGALVGGAGFILPGLVVILALSVLFLTGTPPLWVLGAGAGAGAAVPTVAVQAGWSLFGPSWRNKASGVRWACYLAAGLAAAPTIGPWLVLVLLGCGAVELLARLRAAGGRGAGAGGAGAGGAGAGGGAGTGGTSTRSAFPDSSGGTGKLRALVAAPALVLAVGGGVLASVAWEAFKIGGLSFGGGFVIIPLMQADVVGHYHWMTGAQFLNAVALGQITPGPVVQTVAVVGYSAAGLAGGLLASAVAFTPSFLLVLFGGPHFQQIRGNARARAFLDGAGPAAIGAIFGSAIALTRVLSHPWQYAVLAGALVLLLPLRGGVVLTLLSGAAIGVVIALATGSVAG